MLSGRGQSTPHALYFEKALPEKQTTSQVRTTPPSTSFSNFLVQMFVQVFVQNLFLICLLSRSFCLDAGGIASAGSGARG